MVNVISYPSDPTLGKEITVGATKKRWDGEKWVNKSFGNHELRLQSLEEFEQEQLDYNSQLRLEVTLAEALSEPALGAKFTVRDLGRAPFDVVPASDSGGYYYTASNGNKLKLVHVNGRVHSDMFRTDSAGLLEAVEYMTKNHLHVTWRSGEYTYNSEGYVEIAEPTILVWKSADGNLVTFKYTGTSPISHFMRHNNCLAAQLHNISFESNLLVASPLHVECNSILARSVGYFNVSSADVAQINPVTTSAAGLIVSGAYKNVHCVGVSVDGVTNEDDTKAAVGLAITKFGGIAELSQLNIRNITTVHDKDADGLSVFGSDVTNILTYLGGRLEVRDSVFSNCEGRFIKSQVSNWEVHGCTFNLPTGAKTITEWRAIDGQANNGNLYNLTFQFGANIVWGSSASLITFQNIRNDGYAKASIARDINISCATDGLARLFTLLAKYGTSSFDIGNVKMKGATVQRGVLVSVAGGVLADVDKVNVKVREVSVPDYSNQDLIAFAHNLDYGNKVYLEAVDNRVENNSSLARLYNNDPALSLNAEFKVSNNDNLADRIDWVFNLDLMRQGCDFYTGGQTLVGAPNGTFAHYSRHGQVQRAINTTGTAESRRTKLGASWNAWTAV